MAGVWGEQTLNAMAELGWAQYNVVPSECQRFPHAKSGERKPPFAERLQQGTDRLDPSEIDWHGDVYPTIGRTSPTITFASPIPERSLLGSRRVPIIVRRNEAAS